MVAPPYNLMIHQFLSTLSLRRATMGGMNNHIKTYHFYPRSPCGERLNGVCLIKYIGGFLSTLSLRRATPATTGDDKNNIFLSTLSLRRATPAEHHANSQQEFLSTLSLRRATQASDISIKREASISIHALLAESDLFALLRNLLHHNFYPRSPCGERPKPNKHQNPPRRFLSTLSLRRATYGA